MKNHLKTLISTFCFLLFSVSLLSQKKKVPKAWGVHVTSDIIDYYSSSVNIGSDIGISCNLFLSERFTLSSSFSYGKKRYDITVVPIGFLGLVRSTRKVFDETSISFEGDLKYNLLSKLFKKLHTDNPSLPKINPFWGIGFIVKSPIKINGLEEDITTASPLILDWNQFEIDYADLSFNYGTKLISGVDFRYAEHYFLSVEFGACYYPQDGFKDLRNPRFQRVGGLNKNENHSYVKFGIGYVFK